MLVKVDTITRIDEDTAYKTYSDIEDWDVCENSKDIYHHAKKILGRCVGKVYQDPDAREVGWVFQKRENFEDSNSATFLMETWVCPIKEVIPSKVIYGGV